jgi:aspartate dehydrogenase
LSDLSNCGFGDPTVIVEVAHPDITRQFGAKFLAVADFMIGSPTALADVELETALAEAATKNGLYIPSGALWGGEDIRKMSERGTLKGLTGMILTFNLYGLIRGESFYFHCYFSSDNEEAS